MPTQQDGARAQLFIKSIPAPSDESLEPPAAPECSSNNRLPISVFLLPESRDVGPAVTAGDGETFKNS